MSSSSSDDESLPAECDWCHDNRGLCDMPHLDDDRRFSIKLEETFELKRYTMTTSVIFIIKHDFNYFNV